MDSQDYDLPGESREEENLSTLSDRIRTAALGPAPRHNAMFISSWTGTADFYKLRALGLCSEYWSIWRCMRNDRRRMVLLFLAEAVK